jgi:hypothetical protein
MGKQTILDAAVPRRNARHRIIRRVRRATQRRMRLQGREFLNGWENGRCPTCTPPFIAEVREIKRLAAESKSDAVGDSGSDPEDVRMVDCDQFREPVRQLVGAMLEDDAPVRARSELA